MFPLARGIGVFPKTDPLHYALKIKIHEKAVLLLHCLFYMVIE